MKGVSPGIRAPFLFLFLSRILSCCTCQYGSLSQVLFAQI